LRQAFDGGRRRAGGGGDPGVRLSWSAAREDLEAFADDAP